MVVAIAGGHGKIGLRLTTLLAERGDRVLSLIRNPAQADHVSTAGGEPVIVDLESAGADELAGSIQDADAVVFAAGAGPGSGAERKRTVDFGAAVKCVDAAESLGVRRFVIVSSIGAHDPEVGPESMRPYLRAKAEADGRVAASTLDWTIVRPGSLTDDPGTGLVDVSTKLGRRGPIPREDVALVLAETLQAPGTIGLTFEVFSGETQAREALRSLGA